MAKDDPNLRGIAKTKALEGAITKLTQTITDTFQDFTKFERSAAGLGMDYDIASRRLSSSMEGLRGGITERLTAALTATQAGLFGNTRGISQLLNQQRLTGLNAAKTAKTFASLENELGMSREATNALGPQLVELSKNYSISTDTLVDSIGGLSASFRTLNLAGIGDQFAGTMALLQAEFGEGNNKILGQFMTEFLNPSVENIRTLGFLGIDRLRAQAIAEKDQVKQAELIKKAMLKAAEQATSFVGSGEESLILAGILREQFGEMPGIANQLAKTLEKGLNKEQEETKGFFNQIKILTDEALSPLKELFFELTAAIKPLLPEFTAFVKEGMQAFADSIRDTIDGFGGLKPAVIALKDFFKDKLGLAVVAGQFASLAVQLKVVSMVLSPFGKLIGVASSLGRTFFLAAKSGRMLRVGLLMLGRGAMLLGGPITALISIVVLLEAKFGILGKAFDKLKSWFGFGGGGESAIDSLRENHELTNQTLAQTNVATHELVGHVRRGADASERMAGAAGTTSADFMTETANILSRSVESILGIESDDSAAELVELMREQNAMIANSDRGNRVTYAPQDSGRD